MAKRTKASARKKGAAQKAVGPVKPIPAAYHVRDVHVSAIVDAVKKLCIDANLELEPDMLRAFDRALTTERSAAGKQVLQILKDNAQMARTRRIPYCQDTGFVVCFVELGQDVHVTGGVFYDAINEGVRQGYTEGYLRASIVRSPFDRVNTGDNTPAVIHVDVVPGAALRLQIMAKGGGCENRSKYTMLTPAAGIEGVKDFIIDCVKMAGPDACPPLILGVGVGGTFEKAALLSKKALFREVGSANPDPTLDALEKELLARANRLGIGPQGYGGDTTALGIHVLTYPCHITSLPVAVTIECHAHRHKEATL
jgi:fumarate hydratase subunit alpha